MMSGPAYDAARLACFGGVLGLMLVLEHFVPRRELQWHRTRRWTNNAALVLIDTVAVRLFVPITLVGVAVAGEARGWGLLHLFSLPAWVALVVAVVAFDLAIYAQHVAFHKLPWLWRLHRVHHSDPELDVTTALRFHPVEIALSLGIKAVAIIVIGAPVAAVGLFEILLNATAMFNHANVALPRAIDRWLRLVLVTPDMHRVHHSVIVRETDSNYGFNLPWWDRLFGTYRAEPERGHLGMEIGLHEFRTVAGQRVDQLLLQPLKH